MELPTPRSRKTSSYRQWKGSLSWKDKTTVLILCQRTCSCPFGGYINNIRLYTLILIRSPLKRCLFEGELFHNKLHNKGQSTTIHLSLVKRTKHMKAGSKSEHIQREVHLPCRCIVSIVRIHIWWKIDHNHSFFIVVWVRCHPTTLYVACA